MTLIVGRTPRLTSFWIISSQISPSFLNFPQIPQISLNFLSNSLFPSSLAGRLEQLKSPWCSSKLYLVGYILVDFLELRLSISYFLGQGKGKVVQIHEIRCLDFGCFENIGLLNKHCSVFNYTINNIWLWLLKSMPIYA